MFFKCHIFQEHILCILHFSIMVHEVKIDDLAIQIFRTSLLSFCVLVLLVMRGVLKFQTTSHGFVCFSLKICRVLLHVLGARPLRGVPTLKVLVTRETP